MKRKILLTIDDSPSPLMADRLRFLETLGIRVLWFCRGDHLQRHPGTAIDALQAGHALGNHSWSHPHFSRLSLDQAREEIDRTEEMLESVHARAGVARAVRCFRFPYEDPVGSPEHAASLQSLLRTRGFEPARFPEVRDRRFRERADDRSWSWTFDLEDWTLEPSDAPGAATALKRVLARLDREIEAMPVDGRLEVFVGHDHAHTVGQWEAMILRMLDLGCVFVPLEEALAPTSPARALPALAG